jgi:acyl carrier protein
MSDAIRERVQRAMADLFDLEAAEITAQTSPETLEAWDSVNHLSLVMALEQMFGVAFDLDEIPELTSLEAIVGAVERRAGGRIREAAAHSDP